MIIGLFGFSFDDRNRGCEALTYSFISVLREIVKDKLIIINLSGVGNIEKIENRFPSIKFEMVGFQKNKISLKSFICLLKCDYIFDCTFGDNFSDIYSLDFVSRTTNYKELALLFKKRFVLAPQTIGPFKDENIKKRVSKVLKRCDLVFSRDYITTKYVRDLAGVEAITVTDLAFMLPCNKSKTKSKNKKKVGVNVSGLLWASGLDGKNQFELKVDYKKYIEELIRQLKYKEYDVHLIPHVFSEDDRIVDEDYKVCKMLGEKFEVNFSGYFIDPIEAKDYISNMDIFIGARMHSTIAAFSSGVITIPFSYSRKFEGLYNSLGYYFIVNGRELNTQEAITATLKYIDNSDKLKTAQELSITIVNDLEKKFACELYKYIYMK